MTIKELIDKLNDYPEDSPVWALDDEGFVSYNLEIVTDSKHDVGILPKDRMSSPWR